MFHNERKQPGLQENAEILEGIYRSSEKFLTQENTEVMSPALVEPTTWTWNNQIQKVVLKLFWSRSKISSWNHSESKEHTRNIFPSYSYEGRISKSEKSFMHILLAFLKLIFKLNSLIKSLRKKIHFFKIDFSTSIFQTYFGCALSIPNDFRTIFWI